MKQALEELVREIESKRLEKASRLNMAVSWSRLAKLAERAREALRIEALKPEIGGYDPDLDIG